MVNYFHLVCKRVVSIDDDDNNGKQQSHTLTHNETENVMHFKLSFSRAYDFDDDCVCIINEICIIHKAMFIVTFSTKTYFENG